MTARVKATGKDRSRPIQGDARSAQSSAFCREGDGIGRFILVFAHLNLVFNSHVKLMPSVPTSTELKDCVAGGNQVRRGREKADVLASCVRLSRLDFSFLT